MDSNIERYSHPLFNPLDLVIETKEISRLRSKIIQWIWTGATGGVVLGEARSGKSTAIETIHPALMDKGEKNIPSHLFSVATRDKPSITSIYRNMCASANLRLKTHEVSDEVAVKFLNYLMDAALEHQSKKMVLFVDEMQKLTRLQLDAFAELYNRMRKHKILLTVIFVGNIQESSELLDYIARPGKSYLRDRFFINKYDFYGIKNEESVKFCLSQYDHLRFPEKTGPTYTQFFLPREYKDGWRLASISPALWRYFRTYQKTFKISSWGMQYFIATVNVLVTDYLPQYGIEGDIPEMINESIKVSGLVPALVQVIE